MTNTAKKISEFEKLVDSPQSAPKDQNIYWFIARASVLKGPFSQNEVLQKLEDGEISNFDYAWRQGFQEWRPLGSLAEIPRNQDSSQFGNYPTLPVPGFGAALSSNRVEDTGRGSSNLTRKRRDVQVRLRTSSRHFFNPRQGTVAVLFALLVAFVTNYWAQNQIFRNVNTFFQNKMAGRSLSLGENSQTLPPPEAWTPLFSAPGYMDAKATLNLPVRIYGLSETSGAVAKLREQKIDIVKAQALSDITFKELDPIFVRPLEIYGQLNPHRPQNLRVKQLGEPILESFWEK